MAGWPTLLFWVLPGLLTTVVFLSLLLPPSPHHAKPAELDAFYSGFGGWVDKSLGQLFEHSELVILASHSHLENASAVVEFGCGDGAFADELLSSYLPSTASYRGLELSERRRDEATHRLQRFGERVVVTHQDAINFGVVDGSVDRVISTFVIDLLSHQHIDLFLAESRRALVKDGLLCLSSLSFGQGPWSVTGVIAGLWNAIHTFSPASVGGCRPLDLVEVLSRDAGAWEVVFVHHDAWLPMESVVARKL